MIMELICITLLAATGMAFFAFLCVKSIETGKPAWVISFVLYVSAIIAIAVVAAINEGKKGPCLEYKTTMMYNAAIKTMMPAKVCVERGEWVNDDLAQ